MSIQAVRMGLIFIIPHLFLVFIPSTFSWTNLLILFVSYYLSIFGLSIGYHRYLCHKGFTCGPILKFILLSLGAFGFQGSPLIWRAVHTVHHLHTDTDKDPHSPVRGFWFSYYLWLMDEKNIPDPKEHAKDYLGDRMVMFMDKYYAVWVLASLLIPYLLFGWEGLIWGGFLRMVFVRHMTSIVSSVGHMGKVSRNTKEKHQGVNSFLLALLLSGDGWHQNHHDDEDRVRHGIKWWQIDVTWYVVCLLEKLGLVWNIKGKTPRQP